MTFDPNQERDEHGRWSSEGGANEAAPLIRTVGKDFSPTFFHGTAEKNLKTLGAERPASSAKPASNNIVFNAIAPPEQNEFNAKMLLAEPRQPQQANLFAQGQGNTLAAVTLKDGTRILDLSDEATRTPRMNFGGPDVLNFLRRPAMTDDLIAYRLSRVSEAYKQRNPDWRERITAETDPASKSFHVDSWRENLVPFAASKGLGAIRFADETLVVDHTAIASVRKATADERRQAATQRAYPGSKYHSLFTDQPTGAYAEARRGGNVLKVTKPPVTKRRHKP